jgi:3-oxoacyl-[acyl-carrier protein] reductase
MKQDRVQRNIVVTGGARGIGRAILERFVAGNDHVIVADILPQPTDLLEENLVTYYNADLSALLEVERFAEEVASGFECVDVLVNNAATGFQYASLF